jgi:superfamily II RNA helicase
VETYRGLTLNPFQRQAFAALREEQDVLVSAPTGAGKTLIAEYAVEQCIQNQQRAIYTAPIKALSNQKYRDFRGQEGVSFEIGIMTGDVTIRPGADLLIMTTEIFRNTILERSEELEDVGYVIYDEIHYMDDPDRGTVWEESIIFAPESIRFLGLSATVSNLKQFSEWIHGVRGRPFELIRSTERPVPLRHYLHFPDLGPKRADKVTRLFKPKRQKGKRPRGRSRVGSLLDRLQRLQQMPTLFFCFSRRECEARGREQARRRLLREPERASIETLFDQVCDRFEIQPDATLEELRALALEGISYHHAGLLPLHKELVERLFTSGLLRLLFTTETFALGINMPAHSVVFSSLRKFDGVGFDRLKTREYQQMAGRAGRQGMDAEGLVFSVLDDDRVRLEDVRKTIFGSVEPIRSRFNLSYSTILNLHMHLGERIFEAWEKSFNNFQWARMSRKKREQNERRQRQAIQKRLQLLKEFEYLDADGLLPKGDIARRINGYELPAVELMESGLFRALTDEQVALILTAVVFEERRSDLYQRMPKSLLGTLRGDAENILEGLIGREREANIHPQTRRLNFKIGGVVHAWWEGWSFDEIGRLTNASHGDLVRTFRLVVQLLKQMRKVYSAQKDSAEQFERILERLNRDEVDARRQIELGDEPEHRQKQEPEGQS